ncbi:MAG: Hsp20/alpha crystallin family protein, partial [Bacteriovorax sp.]
MSIFKSPIRSHLPMLGKERGEYDLFKEFEDLFNRNLPVNYDLPKVPMSLNIQESKEGYHIEAELPGVKREEINVSMKGDYLVIKGEKKSFNEEKKDQYHRIERSHGSFYRAVQMPKDVDHENINAELKDGVLKIDVMKSSAPDRG